MGLRSMVVAPYESATDVDINASLEKRAGDRFEQVDLVTRRTLAVFGALSGRAGGVSIDTLRIPSIVYHGFLCLLYMTNLVVSLLVAWDKTEESIASIMMKTAIICWYTVGVSDSISGFIISHWKGGLPNYQEELSLAADEMEQCGIEIDHNRIRKFLSVTYQIGVAVSLAGVTIKVLDFTSVINIDAIYGISLKDRIEDRDTLKVAQIFGLVVSVIMNFISTLGPLFLVQTCQILRRLFLDFDRHLERLVTSSQTELQQKLPALRLVYCRLRELVQCANAWVSVFSAGIFLVSVADCLVVIFIVAKAEKFVLVEFIAYAYWIGFCAAILVIVITYADKMSREVSTICHPRSVSSTTQPI